MIMAGVSQKKDLPSVLGNMEKAPKEGLCWNLRKEKTLFKKLGQKSGMAYQGLSAKTKKYTPTG